MPLWSQIEEGIRHLVAVGQLPAGAAVPSVRDLARELKINPATVSKAYQRLTDQGTLEVRRGDGTYVTSQPAALARAERSRLMREGARRFANLAATLGQSRKDATAELEGAWSEMEAHSKRGER